MQYIKSVRRIDIGTVIKQRGLNKLRNLCLIPYNKISSNQ